MYVQPLLPGPHWMSALLGFAARIALAFAGVKPGIRRRRLVDVRGPSARRKGLPARVLRVGRRREHCAEVALELELAGRLREAALGSSRSSEVALRQALRRTFGDMPVEI